MKIQLRYFASLREALGASDNVEVGEGSTVATLRDMLLARGRAVRCALNQALCDESAPLIDGAEVAFFPPVTGG